jgi:hypothetical protein
MANTAPNPYELPGDHAGVGVEVLDQAAANHGGPYYTGTGANALYRNYRGTLVHDGKVSDVGSSGSPVPDALAPVLYDASHSAEYKPRILGKSQFTTERVVVRFYLNCIKNLSGAGQMTFSCLIGSTAATATATILNTSVGWVTLLIGGLNPLITDTTETEEFTCSFSVDSGPWDQTRVEAVHIYYPVDSTALPAPAAGQDGYPSSGFVPLDADQFQGEKPRTTSSLKHLARNLQYLDTERVGNFCGAGNMSIGATLQGDAIFDVTPPENVTSARFWVKTHIGSITVTITSLGGSGASGNAVCNNVTWTSIDVTVTPGVPIAFLISTALPATQWLTEVSGYWRDV